MAKVFEFLATGFEEVEALAVVDVLRRAGVDIKTVSVTGDKMVAGSHGIEVKADLTFEEANLPDADLLLLPGGLPGSTNLLVHEGLRQALLTQVENGKKVGAICAAPMVLGDLGILKGKKATCYPGCEDKMIGADYTAALCTVDGNIITGAGPAATFPYAYKILEWFVDDATIQALKDGMIYTQVVNEG